MKVDDLIEYITQHMTAEQALKKLLQSSLLQYEKLKFDSKEESVHPLIIIAMAAMDMGWNMAVHNGEDDEQVEGIAIGTERYMKSIFPDEQE